MEAFHKDQALVAKQKSHKLALENQELLAQLEAAENMKAEQLAFMNAMHQELASKSQALAELRQHEGQMEAQFLVDQQQLHALVRLLISHSKTSLTLSKYNEMVPQLIESQKLLMKRDEDIEQLNRLLVSNKVHLY